MGTLAKWNVLVTAQVGRAGDLRRELRRLGSFRWGAYRNVLAGHVADTEVFLTAVGELLERKPFVRKWIGKAIPIELTYAVDPDRFIEDTAALLPAFIERIDGRPFHVRIERRGHKGVLRTDELERTLGDRIVAALHARGITPTVRFEDAEVVLVIEMLGDTAGIALLSRALRERHPIVRID